MRSRLSRWAVNSIAILIVAGLAFAWYSSPKLRSQTSSILTPTIPETALPPNPFWRRPLKAPNGSAWPEKSDYVAGYPRLNVLGPAQMVADNSGGSNDLFVKLIDRDQKPAKAVRVFHLKAKDKLALARVKPGHYDIRYMNLRSGRIRRTGAFEVTLKQTPRGSEYMGWVVPLYEVVTGTTYHPEISEREF